MAKKVTRSFVAGIFATLAMQSAMADKVGSVSVERMTYDSDVVFLGHAIEQTVVSGGFVFIDTDRLEKKLDVAIFTFVIDEPLKGVSPPPIQVCTIMNPLKYADIEVGKSYVIFLQRSGKYLQRTDGSLSQIEIVDGKVGSNLFPNTYKELESVDTLTVAVHKASTQRKKRLRSTPYNPYDSELYKIVRNACTAS
jgi:hypothetical protein